MKKYAKMLLSSLFLSLIITACTVIPDSANGKKASADGNDFNSGIIAIMPDGRFNVTGHNHARNEDMRLVYSNRFSPPLAADLGYSPYTNGTWLLTKQGMVNFNRMNHWRINPTVQ